MPVPVAGARVSPRAALTFRNLSNYVDFCYALSHSVSAHRRMFSFRSRDLDHFPRKVHSLTHCLQDPDNPDILTQAAEERLAECEDRRGRGEVP